MRHASEYVLWAVGYTGLELRTEIVARAMNLYQHFEAIDTCEVFLDRVFRVQNEQGLGPNLRNNTSGWSEKESLSNVTEK